MKPDFKAVLRVQPLGGLSQIGSNLTLLKQKKRWIIIDAGILFPNDDTFEINYLIPDLSVIDKELITDIVITHGHEDHIGAIHHIVNHFPHIVIWATPFTADLIRDKLNYKNLKAKIEIFHPHNILVFDDLAIHPIEVNHSIPETNGFFIEHKTKNFALFFASDFKYDFTPLYELGINTQKLKNLASSVKKNIAMLDSTNILSKGKTKSETDLVADIEEHIKKAPSRVFITLFSSNISRIQTIFNAAKKQNKKIILLGRSLERYIDNARRNNVLHFDESQLRTINSVSNAHEAIYLVSGCQGDFFSALRRLAYGEHGEVKLTPFDTIIFSSKTIPGNEKKLSAIYNKISEIGTTIVLDSEANLHASGHPGQADLKALLEHYKPDEYVPIHGESFFLKRHQEFINQNYPHIKTHLMFNADELIINESGETKLVKGHSLEPILIHGNDLVIEREKVSQRRKMAGSGMVFITLDPRKHFIKISQLGLPSFIDQEISDFSKTILDFYLKELTKKNESLAKEEIRVFTRRLYNNLLGYKPVVETHLIF